MDDILVVRKYSDAFLEDFPGVPPEMQVDFRIDLILGATPIAKAPYRLAPPKLQEFSTELLDKGFIRRAVRHGKHQSYLQRRGWVVSNVY